MKSNIKGKNKKGKEADLDWLFFQLYWGIIGMRWIDGRKEYSPIIRREDSRLEKYRYGNGKLKQFKFKDRGTMVEI